MYHVMHVFFCNHLRHFSVPRSSLQAWLSHATSTLLHWASRLQAGVVDIPIFYDMFALQCCLKAFANSLEVGLNYCTSLEWPKSKEKIGGKKARKLGRKSRQHKKENKEFNFNREENRKANMEGRNDIGKQIYRKENKGETRRRIKEKLGKK